MDEAGPDTPLQRGFFTSRSRRVPAPPKPPAAAPSLPDRHGGTAFAVLGREPSVAFATWDLPSEVGEGWQVSISAQRAGAPDIHHTFAAHAHGAYLHGLEPGGRYRILARLLSPEGVATPFTPEVSELALPPALPSWDAEVRFARVPWAAPSAPRHPLPSMPPGIFPVERVEASSPGTTALPGTATAVPPPPSPLWALPTSLSGPTSPRSP